MRVCKSAKGFTCLIWNQKRLNTRIRLSFKVSSPTLDWYCLNQSREIYPGPLSIHDDVIKWKHFPRYLPFVRGIHRSPVNSPHKGQWRGALMFTLICARINDWVNNREAGDLRRYCTHYDVIVMLLLIVVSANARRHYPCNAVSHCIRPCWAMDRNWVMLHDNVFTHWS